MVLFKYYGGGEINYFEVAKSFGVEENRAEPITFSMRTYKFKLLQCVPTYMYVHIHVRRYLVHIDLAHTCIRITQIPESLWGMAKVYGTWRTYIYPRISISQSMVSTQRERSMD